MSSRCRLPDGRRDLAASLYLRIFGLSDPQIGQRMAVLIASTRFVFVRSTLFVHSYEHAGHLRGTSMLSTPGCFANQAESSPLMAFSIPGRLASQLVIASAMLCLRVKCAP